MIRFSLLLALAFASCARAAGADGPADPAHRLRPGDPAWNDITAAFARKPDATAAFSEQRFFAFKKTPLELKGDVRISRALGLSLHYTAPEERIVVLDGRGMLVRQPDGESAGPPDPRAIAANAALVHVLRFDLPALAADFELYGRRSGDAWILALVPRAEELRHVVSEIVVAGDAAEVHRIAIHHTPRQYVEILVAASRPTPFTAEELRRFFR